MLINGFCKSFTYGKQELVKKNCSCYNKAEQRGFKMSDKSKEIEEMLIEK